jgi:hypothetical protein
MDLRSESGSPATSSFRIDPELAAPFRDVPPLSAEGRRGSRGSAWLVHDCVDMNHRTGLIYMHTNGKTSSPAEHAKMWMSCHTRATRSVTRRFFMVNKAYCG